MILLREVTIKNFGCFRNFRITLGQFNSIVGVNGIGKSMLLRAINGFLVGIHTETRNQAASPEEAQEIEYIFQINKREALHNPAYQIIPTDSFKIKLTPSGKVYETFSPISINTENLTLIIFLMGMMMSIGSPTFSEEEYQILHNLFANCGFTPKTEYSDSKSGPFEFLMGDCRELLASDLMDRLVDLRTKLDEFQWKQPLRIELRIGDTRFEIFPADLSSLGTDFEKILSDFVREKLEFAFIEEKSALSDLSPTFDFGDRGLPNIGWEIVSKCGGEPQSIIQNGHSSTIIKRIQRKFNQEIGEYPFVDFPKFRFNLSGKTLKIELGLQNDGMIALNELSFGQKWFFRFFVEYLLERDQDNTGKARMKIFLVDEPGRGLHPRFQKEILSILKKLSEVHQVIFTTHHSHLLDYDMPETIRLMKKKHQSGEIYVEKEQTNKLFVLDELQLLSAKEVALALMEDNYRNITPENLSALNELGMIKNLHGHFDNKTRYEDLINLGTRREDPVARIIQNGIMMSSVPENQPVANYKKNLEVDRILLVQLFKSTPGTQNRFEGVCQNWDQRNRPYLSYSETKRNAVKQKLDIVFRFIELKRLVGPKSLVVFAENILPHDYLQKVVDFAERTGALVIGGIEHFKNSFNYLKSGSPQYEKIIQDNHSIICSMNGDKLVFYTNLKHRNCHNLAIIIDGKNGLYIQEKNVPVTVKIDERNILQEDIPLKTPPEFHIFNTSKGRVAVFICKDFLVNHDILPQWMDLHQVPLVIIPTFSAQVAPFLHKMREIATRKGNEGKYFAFVSMAEYGGSDIINLNMKHSYEPTCESYYRQEEGIFLFDPNYLNLPPDWFPLEEKGEEKTKKEYV